VEFDDRTGPVRDALASSVKTWLAAVDRAVVLARDCGHLNPQADERQIAFEIHGLILALNYEARFLRNPSTIERANRGFENILARHGAAIASHPVETPVVLTEANQHALGAHPKKNAARRVAKPKVLADGQPG
jgi:hypothetical protein